MKTILILKIEASVFFETPVTFPSLHSTTINDKLQFRLNIIKMVEFLKKMAIRYFEVLDLDLRVG
jgi:hypothetical protein